MKDLFETNNIIDDKIMITNAFDFNQTKVKPNLNRAVIADKVISKYNAIINWEF